MEHSFSKRKIFYLVTEDWYFYSHRINLAKAAKKAGFQVTVAARKNNHAELIEKQGIKFIPLKHLKRSSINPWSEIKALIELWKIYRQEKPDITHNIAIKPAIYGSLITKIVSVPYVINSINGLGYAFTKSSIKTKFFMKIISMLFKILLNKNNQLNILQNSDDQNFLIKLGVLKKENTIIIPGSGVDTKKFSFSKIESNSQTFKIVCATRMLWDKGIKEIIETSKAFQKTSYNIDFILCGAPDPDNPSSISKHLLEKWHKKRIIKWYGHVENIKEIYQSSHIVILPSYREGFPKSLLEAASCGKPIITNNVPGCKDVVKNEENGLLIPPQDSKSLFNAIKKLINNKKLREQFGKKGRELVQKYYSDKIIISKFINLYKNVLKESN